VNDEADTMMGPISLHPEPSAVLRSLGA